MDTKVAWLIQDEDPSNSENLTAIHSATLITGLHRAYLADEGKSNKRVQLTLRNGMKHCKLYSRRIYEFPECLVHLKFVGNLTNEIFTQTTPLEIWRSTAVVEAEFKKQCEENTWTMSSIGGQKNWRQLRWQVAEAMYQGRWSNPNSYEVCVRGYKHLVKTVHAEDTKHPYLESTEAYEYAGKSLWEELQHKTSLHADFSKMPTGHQQNVFQVVADLCRLIKVETHLIVDIIMLSIPKVAGIADAGWGKCQICPYGLPLLQSVSDDGIKSLEQEVGSGSGVEVEQKKSAQKQQQAAAKAKKLRLSKQAGQKGVKRKAGESDSGVGTMDDAVPLVDSEPLVDRCAQHGSRFQCIQVNKLSACRNNEKCIYDSRVSYVFAAQMQQTNAMTIHAHFKRIRNFSFAR